MVSNVVESSKGGGESQLAVVLRVIEDLNRVYSRALS